jgi:hypothetical protein
VGRREAARGLGGCQHACAWSPCSKVLISCAAANPAKWCWTLSERLCRHDKQTLVAGEVARRGQAVLWLLGARTTRASAGLGQRMNWALLRNKTTRSPTTISVTLAHHPHCIRVFSRGHRRCPWVEQRQSSSEGWCCHRKQTRRRGRRTGIQRPAMREPAPVRAVPDGFRGCAYPVAAQGHLCLGRAGVMGLALLDILGEPPPGM